MRILILLFLVIATNVIGQNFKNRIQKIVDELPASTNSSIYIIDATTNETIIEKNIDKEMIPASNTKLFTTAAALYLMGPNHEFSTNIYTDAIEFENGIIDGNLFIKGFGNSTFTTKDLDSLVNILVSTGIKIITGDIIGDDSYFDNLYTRDDWIVDEKANVNLPPVSAIIFNRNQFVIRLSSTGKVGSKLTYSISPECSFIDVKMNATVSQYRAYPKISTTYQDDKIIVNVNGGLRKRKSARSYAVDINNPPLFLSLFLKEKLQNAGIKVNGISKIGNTSISVNELASSSIKLDSLISLINKNSNNYLAECLFKSVGAFYSGEVGNSFYATQAVLTTFSDDFIIDDQTAVVDGSGISRFNTITTGSIVRLLNKIYKDEEFFEDYYRSLSISGIDGTLKDRGINNFITGNFHGKTGTLNGVTALAGYLTGKNTHMYIVSIITEFKTKGSYFYKDIEDRIISEIAK